ncbi:MAG: methyltransferase domain-containing protein [Saprospiraceae bacterium]|nr:methyltransferase domain-containing protein [Saprospiraceae bacterium]
MILHKVLIFHTIDALHQIFEENQYSDRVLEKIFKTNKVLGARDRGFIAESVYDILRFYRLYHFVTEPKADWWSIIVAYFIDKEIELPDWPEIYKVDIPGIQEKFIKAKGIRYIRESIPDWLDQLGSSELKDQWEIELKALNQLAPVIIRANTIKISREKLKQKLKDLNIESFESADHPDALILKVRRNIFGTDLFKSGFFELQDASSQLVARFCEVEPGMKVIDACAGAGGKALHLGSLMQNKGQVLALDTEEWKLNELKLRARRNGIHIIETRVIESTKTIKRLDKKADRVLLDVPCSGLGVLRRNPDTKWKLNEEFLNRVRSTQSEILQSYSRMVKPEGKLIYCTCSILPSENQLQVQNFLQKNPDWKLEDEKIILPSVSGYDGFYMAKIVQNVKQ